MHRRGEPMRLPRGVQRFDGLGYGLLEPGVPVGVLRRGRWRRLGRLLVRLVDELGFVAAGQRHRWRATWALPEVGNAGLNT